MEEDEVYWLPVDKDLVDFINPDLQDWQAFVDIMHRFLLAEYVLKSSGALCSAVKNRQGHPAKLSDFL